MELKPCPFCGGEAGITWDKWRDDELYCCVECECAGIGGTAEVATWSMDLLRLKGFRLSLLLADAGGGLNETDT